MAMLIRPDGALEHVGDGVTPISLRQVQNAVGVHIAAVACEPSVCGGATHYYNSARARFLPYNRIASRLAQTTVYGNALFCRMDDHRHDC